MRLEKAKLLLEVARILASSPEGLSLDEIAQRACVHRRTAQRMRDVLAALFPQMEEVADGKTKRFRIRSGLDKIYQSPSTSELASLALVVNGLYSQGATARAADLESLGAKVRAAMRGPRLSQIEPDLEALKSAECIVTYPGPLLSEKPDLVAQIRQSILSMRSIRFTYWGGAHRGLKVSVVPMGLVFGPRNYLVGAVQNDVRPQNWNLEWINECELLDTFAAPPTGFDLRNHASGPFNLRADVLEDVVLLFQPESAIRASNWRFDSMQRSNFNPDGSLTISFQSSALSELAWHLLTWRDEITVLAPERLKSIMLDAVARLADHLGAARRPTDLKSAVNANETESGFLLA